MDSTGKETPFLLLSTLTCLLLLLRGMKLHSLPLMSTDPISLSSFHLILQRLGERDGISWERNTTSFSFRTSPISYPFTTTSNECKDRMKWIIFPGIAMRPFYTLRMQQRTMITVSVLRDNNSWSQQERTGREVREMNTAAI